MKSGDVLPAYKLLVRMKELAGKLEDAMEKNELDAASKIKRQLLELQRSLKKIA